MFKKFIMALALLIALPATMFAQKLGVVDTESIVTSLPAFTAMNTELEAASKKYEDEFANLRQKFEKEYADFQALAEDTPASIKERRMTELNELDQKIQQFYATARQDLDRQRNALLEPIQKQVMDAITTVGNEGQFTMIFDKNQPVYVGASAEDVTAKVRAKLGL